MLARDCSLRLRNCRGRRCPCLTPLPPCRESPAQQLTGGGLGDDRVHRTGQHGRADGRQLAPGRSCGAGLRPGAGCGRGRPPISESILPGRRSDAVAGADTVITMLPAGKHVASCYADILPAAAPGTLFIDCSTIDVDSARAAHEVGRSRPAWRAWTRPCLGVASAARRAARSPSWRAVRLRPSSRAEPILQAMGKRIVLCGEAGAGTGGQDLQQHDPGHLDDRRVRGVRAGGETGAVASGAVRRGEYGIRPVLVADSDILPGAGPGTGLAGEPGLCAGFRHGPHAEGPDAGAGCRQGCQRRPTRRSARMHRRSTRGSPNTTRGSISPRS